MSDDTAPQFVPIPSILSIQLNPGAYSSAQRQAVYELARANMAAFGAALHAWLDQFRPVFDQLRVAVETVCEQIAPILRVLGEEMWRQYRAVGSPYGDTHDGLMRWLREASEAQRLRSQAETIEQRWRDQADLREWGRRMRERRAHKG